MVVELRSVPMDKYLVDLDDVDTKLEHVRKPAMAGTDIVDCDAHTETLQGGDCLPCFGEIHDRITFRHFQHDL